MTIFKPFVILSLTLICSALCITGCQTEKEEISDYSKCIVAQFDADIGYNDIHKILIYEFVVSRRLYESYEQLKGPFGPDLRILTSGESIEMAFSQYSNGELGVYVGIKPFTGDIEIEGFVFNEEQIGEFRSSLSKCEK